MLEFGLDQTEHGIIHESGSDQGGALDSLVRDCRSDHHDVGHHRRATHRCGDHLSCNALDTSDGTVAIGYGTLNRAVTPTRLDRVGGGGSGGNAARFGSYFVDELARDE